MIGEEQNRVSFIIPCYNVQNTLLETLSSLIDINLDWYEVICVDDGSIDKTRNIILNFINNNKNLKVKYLYQENQGVSIARNNGIRNSSGDILFFVDADDILSKSYITSAVNCFRNGYDTLMGQFIRSGRDDLDKFVVYDSLDKNIAMKRFMLEKDLFHTSAFFYIKKILLDNNIWFSPGARYGEDWEFTTKYLSCCQKVALTNANVMYYRESDNSAMKKVSYNMADAISSGMRASRFLLDTNSSFTDDFENYMIPKAVFATAHAFSKARKKDLLKKLTNDYDVKKNMKKLFFNGNASLKTRLGALSYLLSWRLFYYFIGRV